MDLGPDPDPEGQPIFAMFHTLAKALERQKAEIESLKEYVARLEQEKKELEEHIKIYEGDGEAEC